MARIFVTIALISVVIYTASASGSSKKCPPNSEPRLCGKLCEPTCERPEELICDPANPRLCKMDCRCVRGYVRNRRTGHCVRVSNCYKKQYSNVPPGGVPDMFGPDNSPDTFNP